MTAIHRDPQSPWQPKETRAYAKNCQMSNGVTAHDQVRIYSANHDVHNGTKCSHIGRTATRPPASPSPCDRPSHLNTGPNGIKHNNSKTNSVTLQHNPDTLTSSLEKTNGVARSPYIATTPNHVILSVPGNTARHKRSPVQTPTEVTTDVPDTYPIRTNGSVMTHGHVNTAVPAAYPIKTPVNGSTPSCLTAEIPLSHIDFWPGCMKRALMACDATFERFEALVQRANKWLGQFKCYEVVSCETVDKKVIYVKDIYNAAMFFMDEDAPTLATHIKGLRLWYRRSRVKAPVAPQEVGFLDVTPRYLNPGEKHPRFETLPDTIDKLNLRLSQAPLPGVVLSVETVPVKIARDDWTDSIKVDPGHCQWYDEFNTHLLNFIRVYYLNTSHSHHSQQLIGIQDFTPDVLDEGGIFNQAKYASFSILFRQASLWLKNNPNVRVTNFQSLNTKHRKKSENHGHRFNTEKMFEYRIEERFRALFLRVAYVMRTHMLPSDVIPGITSPLACRMYLPYKKTTGYENITEMLQRVETVVENTGAEVYHVETVSMPEWLTRSEISECGDLERMFFDGEWFFVSDQDGNDRGPYRYTIIYAIRVYFDGLPIDYGLPPPAPKSKSCCAIL